MFLTCRILSKQHQRLSACAILLTVSAVAVHAQSAGDRSSVDTSSASASGSSGWSSSRDGQVEFAEDAEPARDSALPSAPEPAGQDQNNNNTYSGGFKHRLTIEAGGGAAAPAGDSNYIDWGGGFTLGGGLNFSEHLAALVEYQFLSNGVPSAIVDESGATGGTYHIWSFTLAPVFDLFPRSKNDLYVTVGGGYYRKTTNFTALTLAQFCYYFYYCTVGLAPTTVGSLSSNQGGWNIGGGYERRFGGMYGMSRVRVYVELRYLDVLSPALRGTSPSGGLSPVTIGGGTQLLPIMAGIRW